MSGEKTMPADSNVRGPWPKLSVKLVEFDESALEGEGLFADEELFCDADGLAACDAPGWALVAGCDAG